MHAMDNMLSRKTRFYLSEYSGEHNNYNRNKVHSMNHTLLVVSADGVAREISLGQLEIFLKYAEKYPSMGKALDAVHIP